MDSLQYGSPIHKKPIPLPFPIVTTEASATGYNILWVSFTVSSRMAYSCIPGRLCSDAACDCLIYCASLTSQERNATIPLYHVYGKRFDVCSF